MSGKKQNDKKAPSGLVLFDPPVKIGDTEYDKIQLREPLLQDSLDAEEMTDKPLAMEHLVIASISGVNPEDLSTIGMADYKKLQAVYISFFT